MAYTPSPPGVYPTPVATPPVFNGDIGNRAATPPGFLKKNPGKASAAPAAGAAAGKAAAVAGAAPTAAELISQYNIAKATILKSMADQVQGYYTTADANLQHDVGGLTQDVKQRLFGLGDQASSDLGKQMGGLTGLGTDVHGSFNPDEVANAGYLIGAGFPGESLQKQGAAFASAAALEAPASLEQGQMALGAELKAEGVTATKAATVSASVSKLLGYMADSQGQPIRDAKGKIIPITTSGAGTTGKYHYMQPGDGFTYAYDPATGKTSKVGPGPTKTVKGAPASHYQLKQPGDGFTYVFDPATSKLTKIGPGPKRGQPKPPAPGNSAYQKAVAAAGTIMGGPVKNPNAAKKMYGADGTLVKQGKYLADAKFKATNYGNGTGVPMTTNNPAHALRREGYSFSQAILFLTQRFGITKAQARKALIAAGASPTG